MHKITAGKKGLLIGLAAVLLVIIAALSWRFFFTAKAVKPDDTHKILYTLASKEFQGRLIGTPGNEKAGNYIAEQFKALGLQTFDEDYFQEYNQKIMSDTKFTIDYKDGSCKNFEYSTDFANPYRLTDINLNGEPAFDIKDVQKNRIFVADDYNNTEVFDNAIKAGAAGILVKLEKSDHSGKQSLFPVPVISKTSPGYPFAYISPEIYDQLKSTNVKNIHVKYENKDYKLKNVIGKIPGKTHKKAVIISAHFDHLGTIGNSFYTGAADNASGVTVMLRSAEKILEYSKKNPFDADIYFASFNSEESGLGGSKNFVEWISNKYENIYDINIDTIGSTASGNLLLKGDKTNSSDLLNAMSQVIPKYIPNYTCQEGRPESDYYAFAEKGLCAIGFAQDIKTIHTLKDTPDKLDINYLDKVSNIISDFFETNGHSFFDATPAK